MEKYAVKPNYFDYLSFLLVGFVNLPLALDMSTIFWEFRDNGDHWLDNLFVTPILCFCYYLLNEASRFKFQFPSKLRMLCYIVHFFVVCFFVVYSNNNNLKCKQASHYDFKPLMTFTEDEIFFRSSDKANFVGERKSFYLFPFPDEHVIVYDIPDTAKLCRVKQTIIASHNGTLSYEVKSAEASITEFTHFDLGAYNYIYQMKPYFLLLLFLPSVLAGRFNSGLFSIALTIVTLNVSLKSTDFLDYYYKIILIDFLSDFYCSMNLTFFYTLRYMKLKGCANPQNCFVKILNIQRGDYIRVKLTKTHICPGKYKIGLHFLSKIYFSGMISSSKGTYDLMSRLSWIFSDKDMIIFRDPMDVAAFKRQGYIKDFELFQKYFRAMAGDRRVYYKKCRELGLVVNTTTKRLNSFLYTNLIGSTKFTREHNVAKIKIKFDVFHHLAMESTTKCGEIREVSYEYLDIPLVGARVFQEPEKEVKLSESLVTLNKVVRSSDSLEFLSLGSLYKKPYAIKQRFGELMSKKPREAIKKMEYKSRKKGGLRQKKKMSKPNYKENINDKIDTIRKLSKQPKAERKFDSTPVSISLLQTIPMYQIIRAVRDKKPLSQSLFKKVCLQKRFKREINSEYSCKRVRVTKNIDLTDVRTNLNVHFKHRVFRNFPLDLLIRLKNLRCSKQKGKKFANCKSIREIEELIDRL
jgi:hypothetical protein